MLSSWGAIFYVPECICFEVFCIKKISFWKLICEYACMKSYDHYVSETNIRKTKMVEQRNFIYRTMKACRYVYQVLVKI